MTVMARNKRVNTRYKTVKATHKTGANLRVHGAVDHPWLIRQSRPDIRQSRPDIR